MNDKRTSLTGLVDIEWDVVVIGAGTGGASAAVQLAARGQRVLMIEAKSFPRDKVCGGCLNQRAWQGLSQIVPRGATNSMTARITAAGAVPIDRMRLNCWGQEAQWTTPTMQAISRRTLDTLLVEAAIESGATFCSETSAKVIDDDAIHFRRVQLTHVSGQACEVKARNVIAADGLGQTSLSEIPSLANRVEGGSRIGLGSIVNDASEHYAPRVLVMAVGREGYVGLARVEHNQLNVAAAIDKNAMKEHGPMALVASILQSCRLPVPDSLSDAKWTGTLPLTRTSRLVAARRLFKIGDAASYVEPFTGEGMSWAITDAVNLSELLASSNAEDCDRIAAVWNEQWQSKLKSKQWVCRGLAGLLRRPRMASASLMAARFLPWIPQWLIARASGADRAVSKPETTMKPGVIG